MFSMNALQPIHFTSLLSNPTLTAREIAILKRRHALHQKYEKAVALYADTERPLCEIAAECGFNAKHWETTCATIGVNWFYVAINSLLRGKMHGM